MAPSSLRLGQAGLCFIVTILAILVCCSTPTARNLNFLTNVSSTRRAIDPNANFNGLVLGVRGFCNKNKCASYSSYAANAKKVASNLKLTKPQKKAVVLLAGKGANPSGRAWYQLNILSIIATIASTFAFVLAALLATFAKQGERNQTPIQLSALRMAFLGFLAIAFIMNISTWGYAFSTFNKPKSALEKVKDRGSWGPAFWISLFTWILLLGAGGLEPAANKGQGQDGDQERGGGAYGGGGGGYGNDY